MKQYLDLLQDIQNNGTWKEPARENMPKTISLFGTKMELDMKDGFPLLTTKKMATKAIFVELLWFISGDTNIKYLVNNGCNIWNQDAYRWYLKHHKEVYGVEEPMTMDEFITDAKIGEPVPDKLKDINYNEYGDLGKVYGYQWRNQNGIDQLNEVIEGLKSNPYSRYHIIDAWQKSDFKDMALPPCHLLYQFNCRKIHESELQNTLWLKHGLDLRQSQVEEYAIKYNTPRYHLDLQMYQRSCDTFLGVPFNIASASLFLHLIAKVVNMKPSKFTWIGGDTHIYENHLDQVSKQLSREPLILPEIEISKELNSLKDLENLTVEDIKIINYTHLSKIKAELKTGL